MKSSLTWVALATAFYFTFLSGLHAQDRALEQQFSRMGLKINYDPNAKRYKFVFELSGGRTQLLFVNGITYDVEGVQIREIFSPVARLQNKSDFSQRILFNLLEKNYEYKIGGWQIHGGEPPFDLQYSIRLNANMDDRFLFEMMKYAAQVADAMELELTGTDEY